MNTEALVIDVETNGADPQEVIQFAAATYDLTTGKHSPVINGNLFKPTKHSTLGALATHHILDSELCDFPPSSKARLPDCNYIAGHNVDFDWKALGSPDVKRICTLAIARRLWPELDCHTLGAVCYFAFGDEAKQMLVGQHSALNDVQCVARLLGFQRGKLIERGHKVDTWEQFWQLSERARVPVVMPFGKNKGMAIKDVPNDYARWLLNQPDVDPWLRKALETR